jgi:DNA end-binding protein Ku
VPASRPYWNGYLKLSFVSCPVALYPAASAAERVSFRQVNRLTGHRLRHRLVDSVTGEDVPATDKARGYEVGENELLFVEDRDLAQARSERPPPGALPIDKAPMQRPRPPTVPSGTRRQNEPEDDEEQGEEDEQETLAQETAPVARPQNTRTIEIERFIPAGQIDARYFEKPYYIVPRGEVSQESFAVIRDAMSREGVAGLARVVLSSRERPLLVEPMASGLRGVTLRFAHEVRPEADYFNELPQMKLPAEMMKLAQHIIRTKSAEFDPSMLEDHYRTALVRILQKKQAKRHAPPPAAAPSRENVINLMDALRRSIPAESPPPRPQRRAVAAKAASPKSRKARHRSA